MKTHTEGELLPRWPRLSHRVLARRHVVDGAELIALYDSETDHVAQIGVREWTLLQCADGTRDLDGIVAAASVRDAHASHAVLAEFLGALARLGWLDEGPAPDAHVATQRRPPDRPVDPLSEYTLHCDGRGSCCRFYGSIVFRPAESLRARALRPDVLDGGSATTRAFAPLRGAHFEAASAVTMVDGACCYLDADRRCSLHAVAGADGKPEGCRTYPTEFVDDGEAIRVAPRVECACVLRSVSRSDGDPLVAHAITRSEQLPAPMNVRTLAERIALTREVDVPRIEWVRWTRDALQRQGTAGGFDAAGWFLAVADAIRRERRLPASVEQAEPDLKSLRPWFRALQTVTARRAREHGSWRSHVDLTRRATERLAEAAAQLESASKAEPIRAPADEHFYVRAALHAHQVVDESRPLAMTFVDRAVRVLVARLMRTDATEPAFDHPLAIVEALMARHELSRYVDEVERHR